MPDRTFPLILSILGALTVIVALVVFVDVKRASGRGPRWRRHLLGAGLALLAALGLWPQSALAQSQNDRPLVEAKKSLAQSAQWQKVQGVWEEAQAVASGERGNFPFDRAGKEKLLGDLDAAKKAVEELRASGQLTGPEAGLLTKDLDQLTSGVNRKRPTEMKRATCYKPVMYRGGQSALLRLEARLPLLEKLVAAKRLKRAVLDKVLRQVQRDIALLDDPKQTSDLKPDQRTKAAAATSEARRHLTAVQKRLKELPPPPRRKTCYAPKRMNRRAPSKADRKRRRAAANRILGSGKLNPSTARKLRRDLGADIRNGEDGES